MNTIILNKTYDYESLYDLSSDIGESLDEDYNSSLKDLPKDEYNYIKGKFIVTIIWENDE